MTKVRVFTDMNVILESFRTGCWTALCSHFSVEPHPRHNSRQGRPRGLEPPRLDDLHDLARSPRA